MNRKSLPIIITLIAALISCGSSIWIGVSFNEFVKRFAISVVTFYILGSIIKVVMDIGFKVDEEETAKMEDEQAEGEDSEDENSSESNENFDAE